MRLFTLICNLLPVQKNKVVFYSSSEKYAEGCKYLAEEFLRRNVVCELVWVSENQRVKTPKGIRSVYGRYAMRYELSTANVIIADGRLNKYWAKGFIRKPDQPYFQVGHEGGMGPKKLGADMHEPDLESLKGNKIDARWTNVLLSGSKWESENLVSSYYYWRPPTEWGNPKNDVLLNSRNLRETVREKLSISPHKKVVLYAPSRRDWEGTKKIPELDLAETAAALKRRFGGEWIMLVRKPPQEKGVHWLLPEENGPLVRDVTDYPDTAELLVTADVLISDYSTCAFDYLLTRKPAFLYAPDEEEYAEHHGLYYPLTEAPMPVAHNHVDLLNAIETFNEQVYAGSVERFLKERGNKDDGKASKRVIDWIINKTFLLPSYDLRAIREAELKKFFKGIFGAFFASRNLSIDYKQYKILGFKFKKLRTPIPPKNPFEKLPIEENKIIFKNSLYGYSCNPKYIVEEILRRKLPYTMVWCISSNDKQVQKNIKQFPEQLKLVISGTEESDKEFSTSKVWIDTLFRCYQYRSGIVKRDGQFYLQLWHASFGIKKPIIGMSQIEKHWGRLAESQIDFLISNSDCESKYYLKPVFQFRGVRKAPILKLGHPRSDVFFSDKKQKIREKVYQELKIPLNKKLLLWAPTWRDDLNTKWINLDYNRLRISLSKRFGGAWEIATRMHHMMLAQCKEFRKEGQRIINASEYTDVQELLLATDVLLSDYSSIICDFLLLGRPAFLYVPDYEEYGVTRELAYPLSDTPCPIATSNDLLMRDIEKFDEADYAIKLEKYLNKMGCVEDGHAAARVVDLIEQLAPIR